MRKGIALFGLMVVILGGVMVIMRGLSSGDMSMSGILDRLRLSYPDRSGKDADQVLVVLNLIVIIGGGFIIAAGVIMQVPTTRTAFFSS